MFPVCGSEFTTKATPPKEDSADFFPGLKLNFVLLTKANPNSWCQEIRKQLGHQEIRENARKSPGKYLNSAGHMVYLRLRCSGEPQEEKKMTNFFFLSDFVSGNPRKKNLVFDLFTVKLCIIIRNLPGNYLNLIWNQDQEITLRAPGIRVCLDHDPSLWLVSCA
jgi:hypothetical protein